MITPTPGRIVWYRPVPGAVRYREGEPLAAIIVAVNSDRSVNLAVFSTWGDVHPAKNVVLLQDGDDPPAPGGYCEWMPYQKAVAKGEIAPTPLHAAAPPR